MKQSLVITKISYTAFYPKIPLYVTVTIFEDSRKVLEIVFNGDLFDKNIYEGQKLDFRTKLSLIEAISVPQIG